VPSSGSRNAFEGVDCRWRAMQEEDLPSVYFKKELFEDVVMLAHTLVRQVLRLDGTSRNWAPKRLSAQSLYGGDESGDWGC
jgi:hypothetical protein